MNPSIFQQRRRRDRRRRTARIVLAALALALVGVGAWLVWFSSLLDVRAVRVTGESLARSEQVVTTAEAPMGTPLARVDTAAIEGRVATIPVVERVEVRRSWPRALTIEVTERTAVAWVRADDRIRVVDRFGVEFRTVSEPPDGLVRLRVTTSDPDRRDQAREAACSVVDRLNRRDPGLFEQVRSVVAGSRDSVELKLTRGRTVTWGNAGRFEDKRRVLRALLEIRASGYDVSAPEQPTSRK